MPTLFRDASLAVAITTEDVLSLLVALSVAFAVLMVTVLPVLFICFELNAVVTGSTLVAASILDVERGSATGAFVRIVSVVGDCV